VMVPACWVPEASAGTLPNEPGSAVVEPDVWLELGALVLLPLLLQAAIPTASRPAAPATAPRASRDRRLFRYINCAPWLC
jgi:hypothetical protein